MIFARFAIYDGRMGTRMEHASNDDVLNRQGANWSRNAIRRTRIADVGSRSGRLDDSREGAIVARSCAIWGAGAGREDRSDVILDTWNTRYGRGTSGGRDGGSNMRDEKRGGAG